MYLPEDLVDYIVVHELCHLKEMNHGPKFWALVAQVIPDHKARRKELKNKFINIGRFFEVNALAAFLFENRHEIVHEKLD